MSTHADTQGPDSAFPSLLVHVDVDDGSADRVKLAADLARSWRSELIGIAAAPEYVSLYGDASLLPLDMMEAETKRVDAFLSEAKAIFDRHTSDIDDALWRSVHAPTVATIVDEARRADLLVLGQGGRDPASSRAPDVAVGEVVLQSARPVLVVPPNVERLEAQTIVLAWKDTREIRHAVQQAMPLLRNAREVLVVTVGPDLDPRAWRDVQAHLRRHGLPASFVHRLDAEVDASTAILDIARINGADLIVAGAYGRRRWREMLFGGLTRDLLTKARICCLLSH
ncbi:hypothetical protein ASG43_05230 [Aureimonas sp. Leaf454]|uniref:universal stress protein n=1 Tax=Aureimonas sp. Leaf454 TaxID=1736381 RepID=UPI0006FC8D52|nr:universal stress protein [Aureimonas sp. Leaf454]KQT50690.1 hypothetical protein ASG43_05230 [Aureimonas sp. Leaf454]